MKALFHLASGEKSTIFPNFSQYTKSLYLMIHSKDFFNLNFSMMEDNR